MPTAKKKKRKLKKKQGIRIDASGWTPINFHPKTGVNLKGLGYHVHMKSGKLHRFGTGDHD